MAARGWWCRHWGRATDAQGNDIVQGGIGLETLASIDISGLDKRCRRVGRGRLRCHESPIM